MRNIFLIFLILVFSLQGILANCNSSYLFEGVNLADGKMSVPLINYVYLSYSECLSQNLSANILIYDSFILNQNGKYFLFEEGISKEINISSISISGQGIVLTSQDSVNKFFKIQGNKYLVTSKTFENYSVIYNYSSDGKLFLINSSNSEGVFFGYKNNSLQKIFYFSKDKYYSISSFEYSLNKLIKINSSYLNTNLSQELNLFYYNDRILINDSLDFKEFKLNNSKVKSLYTDNSYFDFIYSINNLSIFENYSGSSWNYYFANNSLIYIAKIFSSCSDGIKNQDELDIDCGGVCGICSNCFDFDGTFFNTPEEINGRKIWND